MCNLVLFTLFMTQWCRSNIMYTREHRAGRNACSDPFPHHVLLLLGIVCIVQIIVKEWRWFRHKSYCCSCDWVRKDDFSSPKKQAIAAVELLSGAVLFIPNNGVSYASQVSTNLVIPSCGWPDVHNCSPAMAIPHPQLFHDPVCGLRFLSPQWPIDGPLAYQAANHHCSIAFLHLPFVEQHAHLSDARLCLCCYKQSTCRHIESVDVVRPVQCSLDVRRLKQVRQQLLQGCFASTLNGQSSWFHEDGQVVIFIRHFHQLRFWRFRPTHRSRCVARPSYPSYGGTDLHTIATTYGLSFHQDFTPSASFPGCRRRLESVRHGRQQGLRHPGTSFHRRYLGFFHHFVTMSHATCATRHGRGVHVHRANDLRIFSIPGSRGFVGFRVAPRNRIDRTSCCRMDRRLLASTRTQHTRIAKEAMDAVEPVDVDGEEERIARAAMQRVRAAKDEGRGRFRSHMDVDRGRFDFAGCYRVLEEAAAKRKRMQGQLASKHAAGLESERSGERADSRLATLGCDTDEYEAAMKRDVALRIARGQAEVNRRLKEYDLSTGELLVKKSPTGPLSTCKKQTRQELNVQTGSDHPTKQYAFGRVVPPRQPGEPPRKPQVKSLNHVSKHLLSKGETCIQRVTLRANEPAKSTKVQRSKAKEKEHLNSVRRQKDYRAEPRQKQTKQQKKKDDPLSLRIKRNSLSCTTNWSSLVHFEQAANFGARDATTEALQVAWSLLSSQTGFKDGCNSHGSVGLHGCTANSVQESECCQEQRQIAEDWPQASTLRFDTGEEDVEYRPSNQNRTEQGDNPDRPLPEISDVESLWTYSLGELPCPI